MRHLIPMLCTATVAGAFAIWLAHFIVQAAAAIQTATVG